MSDNEFLIEMDKKLDEEVKEYHESKSVEELADILEVVEKISRLRGTSFEQLRKIKEDKINKREAFEKNLFLIDTNEN